MSYKSLRSYVHTITVYAGIASKVLSFLDEILPATLPDTEL